MSSPMWKIDSWRAKARSEENPTSLFSVIQQVVPSIVSDTVLFVAVKNMKIRVSAYKMEVQYCNGLPKFIFYGFDDGIFSSAGMPAFSGIPPRVVGDGQETSPDQVFTMHQSACAEVTTGAGGGILVCLIKCFWSHHVSRALSAGRIVDTVLEALTRKRL